MVGDTDCEPLAGTVPMPSMVAEVALVVVHASLAVWPWSIAAGLTVMLAVGVGGGGGGGVGGGGATVFL
jgi:hypothetical protein